MVWHVFLTGPPGIGKTTLIQKASEVLKSSGVPVDGFYTEEVRQGGRRIGFDVVTLSGLRGPLSRVGSEPLPGKRQCRVGQYVVDLPAFEQLVLPVLRNFLLLSADPHIAEDEADRHLPAARPFSWQTGLSLDSIKKKEAGDFQGWQTDLIVFKLKASSSSGPGWRVCVIDEIGKMELFSQPFIQAVRQTLATPGTVVLGTVPVPRGKPLALVEEIRNRPDVQVFSVTKENRNHLLPDIMTSVQSISK